MPNFPKLAVIAVAASACALAAAQLNAYSAGPPPGHTAGFGEPDCRACHYDYALNEPGISIRLDSLPEYYQPGRTYALQLVVRHAELKRGGFQLSARLSGGEQGGAFAVADTQVLMLRGKGDIDYLSHTLAGADGVTGDSITWSFHWRAPDAPQRVIFNLAVNVSNRDASEFGDRIFTRSFEIGAAPQ